MNTNIKSLLCRAAALLLVPAGLTLASCSAEPDEENMYTRTGDTIEDYIAKNPEAFGSFHQIVQKCGYDRILSAYGTYTCFLPTNDAVAEYIDSLYNDEESVDKQGNLLHNGMTENSLDGLTDSLCRDITLFHLLGEKVETVDIPGAGTSKLTLLGRQVELKFKDGNTIVGDGEKAVIQFSNDSVLNGIVHVISSVIPRSNRFVVSELDKSGRYTIFHRALKLTGLDEKMEIDKKDITLIMPEEETGYYTPTECKMGFTIFAEPDEVYRANGINNVEDLIEKCKEWYGRCAVSPKNISDPNNPQGWYDWYRNQGTEVKTDDNYTDSTNVLNMFVRYHLLKFAVSKEALTLDNSVWTGNGYNGDVADYYETLLPNTLFKVWLVKRDPSGNVVNKTYINRYQTNNTLTNAAESMGPASMHQVIREGIEVDLDNVLNPRNGYIYPLKGIMVYDYLVPNGVLRERMRFDALTLFGEVMSNNFRAAHVSDITSLNGGKSADRIRFPINYLENVVVYNGTKTQIDMNVLANTTATNSFLLYRGDSFQGMGVYDLAIKLPPVPDGLYELRVAATNFGDRGSMMQFYIGESSDPITMEAIDIPVDLRLATQGGSGSEFDRLLATGWVDIQDEENYPDDVADKGLENDKVMRTHNYMRDGLSICKHQVSDKSSWNARFRAYQLRRIIAKRDFTQREYWLRMKSVLPKETTKKYQLDYVELVPVSVYENGAYMEDMY